MSASIKSNIKLGRVDMSLAKSLDRQKNIGYESTKR
jgi:hypothetical protein